MLPASWGCTWGLEGLDGSRGSSGRQEEGALQRARRQQALRLIHPSAAGPLKQLHDGLLDQASSRKVTYAAPPAWCHRKLRSLRGQLSRCRPLHDQQPERVSFPGLGGTRAPRLTPTPAIQTAPPVQFLVRSAAMIQGDPNQSWHSQGFAMKEPRNGAKRCPTVHHNVNGWFASAPTRIHLSLPLRASENPRH